MNVIIIIVKKNPLTEIYRKGSVKQLKKNKKTTQQRRHRVLIMQDPNCIKGNRVSKLLLSIDEQKKTHTRQGFLCMFS